MFATAFILAGWAKASCLMKRHGNLPHRGRKWQRQSCDDGGEMKDAGEADSLASAIIEPAWIDDA